MMNAIKVAKLTSKCNSFSFNSLLESNNTCFKPYWRKHAGNWHYLVWEIHSL